MINIRRAKSRGIVFGAVGGLLGWFLAETLWGPATSFGGAFVVGGLSGLGIGLCLGAADGILSGSKTLILRGLIAGLGFGLFGGAAGAFVGQAGFQLVSSTTQDDTTKGSTATMFSTEVQKRLIINNAATGEIEVSLIWENTNDLDLHVLDPDGEIINFANPNSTSGGELDVDKNAACNSLLTSEPVEHIVWKDLSPPVGSYRIFVNYYANCDASVSTPFQVELKVGDSPLKSFSGTAGSVDETLQVSEFVYTGKVIKSAAAATGFNLLQACARILGWLVFGLLVGCAEGVKHASSAALRNAVIGGGLGGAVGGVLFQLVSSSGMPDTASLFVGMIALGACIGLLIAIIDQALSSYLVIENGRFAGREISIDRPQMRLGRNDAFEIYVGGDRSISPHHLTISQSSGGLSFASADGDVLLNGILSTGLGLSDGDRLTTGETTFLVKSRAQANTAPTIADQQPVLKTKAATVTNMVPGAAELPNSKGRSAKPPGQSAPRVPPPPPSRTVAKATQSEGAVRPAPRLDEVKPKKKTKLPPPPPPR